MKPMDLSYEDMNIKETDVNNDGMLEERKKYNEWNHD